MIGFSQANDLSEMFHSNDKGHPIQTSSTANFCDEIDEIMKHEPEDVGSLGESLSGTPLDLDLDSISELLENPRSTSTNFIQSLTITDLSPTLPSPNTTTTSAYSSLGTSSKLPLLNQFPSFLPSNNNNNSHLPPYVRQPDNSKFGASRPLEFQTNQLDVKRFRSASMNDGPSLYPQQQQTKTNPQLFDPYRLRSSTYMNPPPSYPNKPSSPSDSPWPFVGCPRPPSNSFSEIENQQQQQRLNPMLPLNRTSSSTFNFHNPTRNFPQQTLYSINQSTNENLTPPTTKRLSLADFPVEEIKDDPSSPSCTIEQQSEPDLWSDIEQNSSDLLHDNDNTSGEDETNISGDSSKVFENSTSPPRFWKYNVQSKGPKTKRMLYLKERDPHLYREFSDPVYQIKLTQTHGQTLSKLRKGDGNDVTPNPMKLYQLGKQIRDLLKNTSSLYHGIYHHVEHSSNANDTVEAKKEKNKLASKTCRLRKKAQHEANKLKLQGLNDEHKSLIDVIASIKLIILQRYGNDHQSSSSSLEASLDQLIANKYSQSVAGNADGFVEATINEIEKLYSQTRS